MNHKVGKYWQVFVCQLKSLYEYGIDFLLKLARQPLKIFLLVIFWKTVFSLTGLSVIAGLNEGEFISYVLVAGLIGFSLHPWAVYEVIEEHIKKGKLSVLLTRPIRHLPFVFAKAMRDPFVDVLAPLPFVAAIFYLKPFGLQYVVPSFLFLGLFAVSFLLGMILGFMVYYTVSVTMFWTGDLWSIWGTIDSIQALLSGQVIPLTIAPVLNNVANFLPFRHMVFTPAYIFIGKFSLEEALVNMGLQVLWIVGLCLLSSFLLSKGIKKFDSQGG